MPISMSRRPDTAATVTVEFTQEEIEFLDRMRGTGLSRPNEIRTSLWEQADAMGMDPPLHVFDCRLDTGTVRGSYQKRPKKTVPVRVYQRPRKPGARHPWRLAEKASWAARKK